MVSCCPCSGHHHRSKLVTLRTQEAVLRQKQVAIGQIQEGPLGAGKGVGHILEGNGEAHLGPSQAIGHGLGGEDGVLSPSPLDEAGSGREVASDLSQSADLAWQLRTMVQ